MRSFPHDMLDLRLAILGRAGSGKTNAAKVGVETLLRQHSRACILDPTDAWYGLRLTHDGKPSPFDVVIFGGDHGDLPLNEHAGATIGEAIAGSNQSSIVSFANFDSENARKKFTVAFFEALYRHNREHIHLIVDEADTFAPQKPIGPLEATLVARFASIAKRGRIRGIRPWLITQRPASLSKEVLSQVDALISFNLIAPQDRKAVLEWIRGEGTSDEVNAAAAGLAKLKRGTAQLYWPGGNNFSTFDFPLTKTFDSGRTPERGEAIERVKLKPIDVGELAHAVEALVQEREANDPDRLRARIRELEAIADGNAVSPDDLRRAHEEGHRAGYTDGFDAGAKAMKERIGTDARAAIGGTEEHIRGLDRAISDLRAAIEGPASGGIATEAPAYRAAPLAQPGTWSPSPAAMGAPKRPMPGTWNIDPPQKGDTSLEKGPRALLQALAQLSQRYGFKEFEGSRFAIIAGYSSGSGTFAVYMRKLASLDYVTRSGGQFIITQKGFNAAGTIPLLPRGAQLVEWWAGRLDKGPAAMLRAIATFGATMDVANVGEASGYSHKSGTFAVYIRKLRKLKLIEGDGRGYRLGEALR